MTTPPRQLIHRFGRSERAAHWLLAATFASMLATGVFMGGIGAALIGLLNSWRQPDVPSIEKRPTSGTAGRRVAAAAKAILVWGLVWIGPVALMLALLGVLVVGSGLLILVRRPPVFAPAAYRDG